MKPIIYTFTAAMLLVASQVFGQAVVTNFTPATVDAPVGSTVDLQLRVTNFTNINSIQFPITYNSTVLKFDSIFNAALPGFNNGNYNVPNAGAIRVTWFPDPGSYPNGVTVPDNSSIFTVRFTVLTNGTSAVNLANVAPGIEVIKNNAPVNVNFQNGGSQVTASGGSGNPIQGFAIIANTIYIPQGTTGCMPVTVNDFNSIVSMQYATHWDPTILEFQNTAAYNLPDLTAASFGGTPLSGLQLVGWTDPSAAGVTRADGTKIYDVCFKGIGPVGSSSLVTIDGVGFPAGSGSAEAINSSSQNVWTSTSGVKDTIFIVVGAPPPGALIFAGGTDTVGTGEQACIEVTTENFNSIISMQFGVLYDATKLVNAVITHNPAIPGLSAANFNANTPGEIKFSWSDPNVVGLTLPSPTWLFTVCFTVAAPMGALLPINFGSITTFPPLTVEVVKEPDGPVNPFFIPGHVFVGTPVGVSASINTIQKACGGSTGSLDASGTGGVPNNYNWSGPGGFTSNQKTITNLAAGTYTVTVTFVGGQTATSTETLQGSPAITFTQENVQNIKCHGETNGSISLTTGGGTPSLTLAWSGPGGFQSSNEDITGLGAGIYTLLVTDNIGCTSSKSYSIVDPLQLNLNVVSSQNVTCFGASDGQININLNGGTPTFTYRWYDAQGELISTVPNPTNLPPGIYTPTITDINGCTVTIPNPVTIQGPNSALTFATPIQKNDLLCWGSSAGSINVNISGGWGSYEVVWNPQPYTGANLTNIPGGTYNGTITDAGGCAVTLPPVQVIEPSAIILQGVQVVNNICANDGIGSISVQSISGGNGGPYQVTWTGGLSGLSINNLAGGLYIPTVTELNSTGCTAVLPGIQVTEPAPIDTSNVFVIAPTTGMNDGAIFLNLGGGTAPLTIQWSGPGGFVANTKDIASLAPGLYVLTVKDANNCTFTATFTVGDGLVATASTTPSCGDDGCIKLQIGSGIPPFIISWTGQSSGSAVNSSLSPEICNFAPGFYTLTIADNAGNVFTFPSPVQVEQKQPAIVFSNKNDPTQDLGNGNIGLTPVPDNIPMSYNWTGPNGFTSTSNMITGLDSGLYIVTVTNLNSGCTSVIPFTLVRQWPPLVFSTPTTVTPNCNNTLDGSIAPVINGGNPPYIYAWSGPNGYTANTKDITGLLPGTYSLTVTDENGTTSVDQYTLVANSQLAISNVNETSNYGGYQVSGANQCNGVANVVISNAVGTPSILWSNNVTTIQNTTLCAGAYSVTVTDGLGCTAVWSDSLTFPPAVTLTSTAVNEISCHGECDGIIRAFVNGGLAPYTVRWSTGQVDQLTVQGGFSQAVNLCGGNYSVTVTDNLGATYQFAVPLPEPPPLEVVFARITPTTFNSCDGELLVETPGAVEPITYTWSGNLGHSGNTQRAERLCAGEIVQFVVYDGNGCIAIATDTVAYPPEDCFMVRPVITPGQQDGKNDFVIITCIEVDPNNSIEIYNRWGQLVFQTKGYDNASNVWRGTSKNGQPLAEGVYFYVLNVTSPVLGPLQKKGHINLLR